MSTLQPASWNWVVTQGADFDEEFEYGLDIDGAPIITNHPQMDVRFGPLKTAALLCRLDTTSGGGITPLLADTDGDVLPLGQRWHLFVSGSVTALWAPKRYDYSLFAFNGTEPVPLLQGVFHVVSGITSVVVPT